MGLFGKGHNDGGKDTEGLPKRENKEQRQKDQDAAARAERGGSFSVPDRPGRPKGDYGATGR